MIAAALQSFSWEANSSAVYLGLAGDTIPAAHRVPNVTTGVSMELAVNNAMTSPDFHPKCVRRPRPKAMAASLVCAYVYVLLVSASSHSTVDGYSKLPQTLYPIFIKRGLTLSVRISSVFSLKKERPEIELWNINSWIGRFESHRRTTFTLRVMQ